MSSSVFRACTLAACSPRSTGMEPTASKKDFMSRALDALGGEVFGLGEERHRPGHERLDNHAVQEGQVVRRPQ